MATGTTSMTQQEREIRRFLSRVRIARFLGALCEGLVALALGFVAVLLALRLLGVVATPAAWWALLALPAVLWAALAVGRLGFGRGAGAVHLDRRLGLDGLLLTALERDPGAHAPRLREKLDEAHAALPHVRGRPMLARLGLAAVVLGAVVLLPDPPRPARAAQALVTETLAAYAEKLAALKENEGLREETREELQRRLGDLERQLTKSGEVAWKDLDALEQSIEHERALHAARLARARQDLGAFAQGEDPSQAAGAAAAAGLLAGLLEEARSAGLLDALPEALRAKLEAGGAGQGLDGAGLQAQLGAEGMRQLAAALAASAGDKFSELAAAGLPAGLGELSLEEALVGLDLEGVFGEPCKLCAGEEGDEDCPG